MSCWRLYNSRDNNNLPIAVNCPEKPAKDMTNLAK